MNEEMITRRQLLVRSLISFALFFSLMGLSFIAWKRLRHLPTSATVPVPPGLHTPQRAFGYFFNQPPFLKSDPAATAVKQVPLTGSRERTNAAGPVHRPRGEAKAKGDTVFFSLHHDHTAPVNRSREQNN